jgi:hypothetical protein
VEQIEREARVLSSHQMRQLQCDQYAHDSRNHSDIWSLHKTQRLKHYGLHFAKYVGRIARGTAEPKHLLRTLTDTFLINLSAANTLHQDLSAEVFPHQSFGPRPEILRDLAEPVGRFADACEKIDHLEEFVRIAQSANHDITAWVLWVADDRNVDLIKFTADRRRELAARLFYIAD